MSNRTLEISDVLYDYIQSVSVHESDILKQLRSETSHLAQRGMQISPEQGQFMSLLVKLLRAERVIEIGVFTGYSSLCIAQSLSDNGLLVACDINEEWTTIAEKYWQQANMSAKIDLRLAPALETIEILNREYGSASFDMAFIDADKSNYLAYYESCLNLIRPGGLILIDNTLWGGNVADMSKQDDDTRAIRQLNLFIASDSRVYSSLLTIGDGLTLAIKN